MPDLSIPASHHIDPHINITLHTPSTHPALHFQRPGDTEHPRSVSASQGQKPPQGPISPSPAPTTSTHISTSPYLLPLHTPPCTSNGPAFLKSYARHLALRLKKPHLLPISPSRPPTTSTHISTSPYILPLHTPPCASNGQVIPSTYAWYLPLGVKNPRPIQSLHPGLPPPQPAKSE